MAQLPVGTCWSACLGEQRLVLRATGFGSLWWRGVLLLGCANVLVKGTSCM